MRQIKWSVFVYALDFVLIGLGTLVDEIPSLLGEIFLWVGAGTFILYTVYLAAPFLGIKAPKRGLLISEAGRLMYNKSSPELRKMALDVARLGSADMKPSDYFENALIILGRNGLAKLYGRRSPGLDYELIPEEYLEGVATIRNDNISDFFDEERVDWWEVRVARSDAIKGLREYEIDERRQRLRKS